MNSFDLLDLLFFNVNFDLSFYFQFSFIGLKINNDRIPDFV